MKCEFENLIGKEVSEETFKIYHNMYMSTNLSKNDFVKLLCIEAIPESEEAIERKVNANEFKQQIMKQIKALKEEIDNCKRWSANDLCGQSYWKREIKRLKNEIAMLKFVIE